MTNDNDHETVLPIHNATSRNVYNDIIRHAAQLRTALVRAADHAEFIDLPQPGQRLALLSTAYELIWALAEATRNIQHFHRLRHDLTTAQNDLDTKTHQTAPHRTKPDTTDDPPSTDNLDKLDRQLRTHRT